LIAAVTVYYCWFCHILLVWPIRVASQMITQLEEDKDAAMGLFLLLFSIGTKPKWCFTLGRTSRKTLRVCCRVFVYLFVSSWGMFAAHPAFSSSSSGTAFYLSVLSWKHKQICFIEQQGIGNWKWWS